MAISYEWRGPFSNDEVNPLHAEAFGHRLLPDDWVGQVERWSLGWVVARDGEALVGFVNVPWDGGVHAFVLDTMVAVDARHQGIGAGLIAEAVTACRAHGGLEWLHVDHDAELRPFYEDACGFTPTPAGLIALV
jgi:ribosomal protein S18 acetylase RimI-like enzyme